ncbi:unnamed protein product [Schistosoma mattheei]|uniref:Reverse transcriptase domain-containing protein n=1 Tax=Schistosoma mattheei TaxID=31246 RepID=A0A3P8HC55_9TREM|nr:unnamed protein product [Schistosoma mattheei]
MLNWMKDAVDAQLPDQQAGFVRIGRAQTKLRHYGSSLNNQLSGTQHCTSTKLIMKKTFDSVDRMTLWKLLRHYGVPEKIVNIIRNSYDGL